MLFFYFFATYLPTAAQLDALCKIAPHFFSDDFYKPTTDSMDDLYEKVVKGEPTLDPGQEFMLTTTYEQKEKP